MENTAPAFKGAYENGFDGIEFDVYQTKSGAFLVFHDSGLKAGVYFTNTKKEMERLNELEVEYGMSNYKLY